MLLRPCTAPCLNGIMSDTLYIFLSHLLILFLIKKECDVFSILHLDYLHAEQYDVELTISGLADIDVKSYIFTVRLFSK